MRELLTSRYRARLAGSAQDLQAAQALRQLAFRDLGAGLDADEFDDGASHLLIETLEGQAVATFRIATFADGDALSIAYAAQFYDLRAYAAQGGAGAVLSALRGKGRRTFAPLLGGFGADCDRAGGGSPFRLLVLFGGGSEPAPRGTCMAGAKRVRSC